MLVATFYFNPYILFRYIKSDTELYGFLETLAKAKKDLREEYESYGNWLLTEERQVLQAAVYAQAYSNLFGQQMDLLYQDYYRKKTWWGASTVESTASSEAVNKFEELYEETRKCITQASEDRLTREKKRSQYFVSELDPGADTLIGESAYNLGWNFYSNRQYDLATIAYRYALEKLGSVSWLNAAVHNNLGNVYASQKKYEDAAVEYQRAITLDSRLPIFHKNLGLMYYKHQTYDSAVRCYLQAAELEPEGSNKQYLYNDLGNALSRLGENRRADAIEYYRRAIALSPNEPVLYDNLAAVYQTGGEHDLAIKVSLESVRLSSGMQTAPYHYRLGRLYEALAEPRWDEAISSYTQAVMADADIFYLKPLVEAYKKSGKLKDIASNPAIQQSKNITPRSLTDFRSLADIHAMLGDDDAAAVEYEQWVRGSTWNRLLRQGILLEYKLKENQVSRYAIELRGRTHVVDTTGRPKEPFEVIGTSEQKVLEVKPDGSYELEITVHPQSGEQESKMIMTMSRSGALLGSSQQGSGFTTVPFPDKEVRRGDIWPGKLPIPGASGKVVELALSYKLVDIEVRKERICAHITVSGSGIDEIEPEVQQQTSAFGDTWFDYANGLLVESHVESRVVITGGDEFASLTSMSVNMELIEDLMLTPPPIEPQPDHQLPEHTEN
jgi:tetratricopeptide (TPR) repeat protein